MHFSEWNRDFFFKKVAQKLVSFLTSELEVYSKCLRLSLADGTSSFQTCQSDIKNTETHVSSSFGKHGQNDLPHCILNLTYFVVLKLVSLETKFI